MSVYFAEKERVLQNMCWDVSYNIFLNFGTQWTKTNKQTKTKTSKQANSTTPSPCTQFDTQHFYCINQYDRKCLNELSFVVRGNIATYLLRNVSYSIFLIFRTPFKTPHTPAHIYPLYWMTPTHFDTDFVTT